ncbi:MAG: alpha-hydroxy-acid oxidizing protein [Saprospiraceae bacterium]|nr:alpha-hydroxy-acid oxidizing protein [Saprospiraceae bacterium]
MAIFKKKAVDLQREIFLGGLRGDRPVIPLRFSDLRLEVKDRLSGQAFDYLDGGAGAEATNESNRAAFQRWQIVPQMLKGISRTDLSIQLFGHDLECPLFLCPIGVLELAHPEGDLAVSSACAQTNTPLMISSQASNPMEAIAGIMPNALKFFQLYWSKSEELVASFVSRAGDCGCRAIVVTLDTTLLGWRTRDLEHAYLPFLYAMGLSNYISDPVFNRLMIEHPPQPGPQPRPNLQLLRSLWKMASQYPGSTWQNFKSRSPLRAIQKFIEIYMNPGLQWEDLRLLRELTDLPVVLKGIQHPDDARRAVDMGMDGIMVSNHGGRQIDGAIGSLDALRLCREVVPDQMPLLFDSGIRSGADAFKALALGATAVGIGRPYAYALGLAGSNGVTTLIDQYRAELELTMALSGCASIDEINREMLYTAN